MKYKLLAADMDATALNSKKELTPATCERHGEGHSAG